MQNIGILGSGSVAQSLANGFSKTGHKVMLGTSHPEKLTEWMKQAGDAVTVGSFAQAAAFGDLLVVAVKGHAAKEVLTLIGEDLLNGKTVIDTCNPTENTAPENGVLRFFTSINESLMEQLQQAFPEAHFVKAFNSIGAALMFKPDFGSEKPSMFICGNNEAAKKEVSLILDLFGYETEDMGKAEAARAIEPLCMLWCIPLFTKKTWNHAFKLLKK